MAVSEWDIGRPLKCAFPLRAAIGPGYHEIAGWLRAIPGATGVIRDGEIATDRMLRSWSNGIWQRKSSVRSL